MLLGTHTHTYQFSILLLKLNCYQINYVQIAQKIAKKVCIHNFGKVGECKAITCKENGVIYYDEDGSKRNCIPTSMKEKRLALKTSRVHFKEFLELQDDLDVWYIFSNNVHAMLKAYLVEATSKFIVKATCNISNFQLLGGSHTDISCGDTLLNILVGQNPPPVRTLYR